MLTLTLKHYGVLANGTVDVARSDRVHSERSIEGLLGDCSGDGATSSSQASDDGRVRERGFADSALNGFS